VNQDKSNKIKATRKATKQRRLGQVWKVFELKIDTSHLNKVSTEKLNRVFLEAKWLYNYALSTEDIFKFDSKISQVEIKVKDQFEKRELSVLGSQMKQSVIEGLKQNILNLSKKKKKGGKIGRLKFISRCNSIDLKQFGFTYNIVGKRIRIQNIKQLMPVRGMDQISNKGYEFANGKLIKKASGYYLKVTCFKKDEPTNNTNKSQVGLDFGIKTQIALSNGIELSYQVTPPVKKMRRACQNLSAKESHSGNWYKAKTKLGKQYEKITNQKTDIKNKLMHIFKNEFSTVCYQNESIKAWQRIWGKRILNTAIGGITASLKKTPTSVQVDKFFPSTKQCPCCLNKQDMPLSDRMFVCNTCGHTSPRDVKAANMILDEGLRKIGAERIELTPVEMRASVLSLLGKFNAIPKVKASSVYDTGSPSYL